ncbi:acetylornithine transaminase [Uliginosibacterium sp. H3]|uniref:Acetylornithine aminotransferase n=1 Tax=Uliginosibacterium silvisoli TaxID=3114758 RepID=A0ABU6K9N0_9RHOO|nr:acetylornithine transaminase [Uliginosibacterium sp. H3]
MTVAITPDSLMWIAHRPDIVFTEGEGSWLRDRDGKRYLDFVQGWAVNSLGHCPPQMRDALAAQAAKLVSVSPAFYNEPAMQLAQLLAQHSGLDKVFFTSTGAEANEGAIKLARKWGRMHRGGAFEIITFDNSFHGRTLATMSASGKPGWDSLFAPQVPGFPKAQLNDINSVEALITDNTVAVMLEPVQGEAGVIPATYEFMQALRELTTVRGLLLVVDEVQSGMGRCSALFAHQLSGIRPDIMTLGKGLGGGVPLGALLAREEVCCFEAGDQGGTYNGNPLMTAVGLAVLDTIAEPAFLAHIDARAAQLAAGLQRLVERHGLIGERGEGLLRALVLPGDVGADIVSRARELAPEGLLLNAPRPNLLRFMPALNVSETEVEQMLEMLDELLARVG